MTIKTKNTPLILGYIVLNYIAFALTNQLPWNFLAIIEITKTGLEFDNPLITIGIHLIGLILCYLFPPSLKHRLVFLRWNNPLPGSRIFTELIQRDQRISKQDLIEKDGELPTIPEQQNQLWYRIYKKKQDDTVILAAHARWLLFRDLLSVSLILAPISIILTFVITPLPASIVYAISYIILITALWISAINTGNRFACNVLAR